MQPQQTPGQNNYDFILSPNQQPKKNSVSLPGGSSMMGRALIVGVGAIVLIIIIAIVSSVLNSGPDNKEMLLKVVQGQSEIRRISEFATSQGTQLTTRNIASNATIAMTSDRKQLLDVLAQNKLKISEKQLTLGHLKTTDQKLEDAKAASAYDTTYLQILDEQLTDYQTNVQAAYDHSGNKTVKKMLAQDFNNAKLLRQQIDQAQAN